MVFFFNITLALFSFSLGLTLKPQENNARANVWGIQKASCVMSSAKAANNQYEQTWQDLCFCHFFFLALIFSFHFSCRRPFNYHIPENLEEMNTR